MDSSVNNSTKIKHEHKMELVSSEPSESVWECTVKGCDYRESESEDAGSGGG